jgi:hypothetical protein
MAAWLTRVLARIHKLAADSKVALTHKAAKELEGFEFEVTRDDVLWVLAGLDETDFHRRLRSKGEGEWMYEFKTDFAGEQIYLKVVLLSECFVVSFHVDEGEN